MRGRQSVVEDYGKEGIDKSEISIHSSPTSGCVYFMHGSILPVTTPPGQPPGQVQPFGPGGGELSETVLSRG